MSLMNKIPLGMRQQFMDLSSEVVKSPLNARCDMRQASCVRCVDAYIPRWEI